MLRDKVRERFSDEEIELMGKNLSEYDMMFHSSEIKGHCAMISCGYPLFEFNSKYTSEYGDICTLCYDLIQAIRFCKVGSYFAELHRLWQQGNRDASGGTATEDKK
jgi:hypothetical protein